MKHQPFARPRNFFHRIYRKYLDEHIHISYEFLGVLVRNLQFGVAFLLSWPLSINCDLTDQVESLRDHTVMELRANLDLQA